MGDTEDGGAARRDVASSGSAASASPAEFDDDDDDDDDDNDDDDDDEEEEEEEPVPAELPLESLVDARDGELAEEPEALLGFGTTACCWSSICFGACFRCSRSTSVMPPSPIEVQKLMANRLPAPRDSESGHPLVHGARVRLVTGTCSSPSPSETAPRSSVVGTDRGAVRAGP